MKYGDGEKDFKMATTLTCESEHGYYSWHPVSVYTDKDPCHRHRTGSTKEDESLISISQSGD